MNKIIPNIIKFTFPILIFISAIFMFFFSKNIDSSNAYLSTNHLGYVVGSIVMALDILLGIYKILNKNYKAIYLLIIAFYTLFLCFYTMHMFQVGTYSKNKNDLLSFFAIFFMIFVFAEVFFDLKNNSIFLHITNSILIIYSLFDLKDSNVYIKLVIIFLIIGLIFESLNIYFARMKKNTVYKVVE